MVRRPEARGDPISSQCKLLTEASALLHADGPLGMLKLAIRRPTRSSVELADPGRAILGAISLNPAIRDQR
jgi:hypothetical protein